MKTRKLDHLKLISKVILTLTVICLFLPSFATANELLRYRQGTKWVYESSSGSKSSRVVEKIDSRPSGLGQIHFALLRRSDGTQRFVLRSREEFFECKDLIRKDTKLFCLSPIQFAKWPLMIGETWASSEIEFKTLDKGRTNGPDGESTEYYRLAYQPLGADSPIGEVWFHPKWGNLRVDEGQEFFTLIDFTEGKGPALRITEESVLRETLSSPARSAKIPKASSMIQWRIKSEWITPIGIAAVLLVPILFLLIGVFGALRRSGEDELAEPNPEEEMRLLSAIARGGDYRQAREKLKELTEEYPHYPDIRHQLALVYRAEGRVDEAKKTWREVLEKKPDYPDARLGLAALYFATGEFEEASREYREILHLHPEYADARLGMGKSLFQLGKKEKAMDALEEALRTNPNYEEARRLLDTWRESTQEEVAEKSAR